MIAQLNGEIIEKNPPEILFKVGDITYELLCPMSSFYKIGDETSIVLHTHLQVKEDAHTLYGFISKDEKTLFRELIRVNGVGPKAALAILSHLDIGALVSAIVNEDDAILAKTPSIGKKTAQKLIVELKDRLAKLSITTTIRQTINISHNNPNTAKALQALQALGFKTKEAEKMLGGINDNSLSTESLIRQALQNK